MERTKAASRRRCGGEQSHRNKKPQIGPLTCLEAGEGPIRGKETNHGQEVR